MKTSPYFPLVVSSLVVGGAMLFSSPAQSFTLESTFTNVSSSDQIEDTYVLSGLSGGPLNVISVTSPQFPTTLISNNNTNAVSVSTFGGVVQPGGSITETFNIADNPSGPSGFSFLSDDAFDTTASGVQEVILPDLTITTTSNPAGVSTPFSAYSVLGSTTVNGQPLNTSQIIEGPGNQLNLSGSSFAGTLQISSQPIPGIVPIAQLNNFGPPIQFNLTPGGSVTVPAVATVPEPSNFLGTLTALGIGTLLKWQSGRKKALKNQVFQDN